ncbi:MAG: DNA-processing protein DprA [Agrococcus casei]|uniref:DNA-processing protein DprA n=1 Tax=Agrococcus casei TaxID=343512 RepID=UPI003F90E3C2
MTKFTDLATDERTARIVLSIIAEPNDSATGRLLTRVGAVETIRLLETDSTVPVLGRVDGTMWRERLTPRVSAESVAERLREVDRLGIGVLIPGDRHWPAGVDDLGDSAPFVLWTKGAASFLARPPSDLVTITGARAATSYGEHVAAELASDLVREERGIIAGGAYGIEGAAHRAALASGGDTIAVLASGVDRPYPAGHSELLRTIADTGLLVSEMPPGVAPTRHRFLARGRLMAALSQATVVVEAGARSGALQTALQARLLGRGLGSVPGPVTSAASFGTNDLLRDQSARVVTGIGDVRQLLDGHTHLEPRQTPEFSQSMQPSRATTPSPGL